MDELNKVLFTLDSGQWVKRDIEGPKRYPEELEANFRELRNSTLDKLLKQPPEPTEPLDRLVENGKYLKETQLKYILTHLGLSSHALVNAPNVDAPRIEEEAIVEAQLMYSGTLNKPTQGRYSVYC